MPGSWHGAPDPSRLATWRDTLAALDRPDACLLDTRSVDEHLGRLVRARRGGTIPGSVNVEWTNNLTADDEKRWKSADELREMYAACGLTPDKQIITV